MNLNNSDNKFTGFPTAFTDFLFSLRFNNTFEMLPQNKETYKTLISEPLTLLFNSLVPAVLSVSDTLEVKPSKCVSAMYADMRFSRAAPLKEYMYIRFREPHGKANIPGLYFDMGLEHYSYGIRIYKQTAAGMARIREGVLNNRPLFIRELSKLTQTGITVRGNSFAKDRFPDEKNAALKELLNCKNFYIGRDCPVGDNVFNGEIRNEIADAYEKLKGLYLLLRKSLGG
jgi:uncharacterized protein (DUF2461 family)